MNIKKYVAEFIGTFTLASAVVFISASDISQITALFVGLIVTFFVYTIGSISGAHINPAITLGLWSIKKISPKEAGMYIIAQLLAGIAVLLISSKVLGIQIALAANAGSLTATHTAIFFAEFLGTLLFAFGIASVVYGAVERAWSGAMIGLSLFLGVVLAILMGSNGALNPAVALAAQSLDLIYLIAPILGSIVGMQFYVWLKSERVTR